MPGRTTGGGSISAALTGKVLPVPAALPTSVISASRGPSSCGDVTVAGMPSTTRAIAVSGTPKAASKPPSASIWNSLCPARTSTKGSTDLIEMKPSKGA